MTKVQTTTETYKINEIYWVNITKIKNSNYHEAWLWNIQYGIKEFMFGCKTKTIEEFLDLVEGNAEEYINFYREEVEDEENQNNNIQI